MTGERSRVGVASVADEEIPQHIQTPLDPSQAVTQVSVLLVHMLPEVGDFTAQALYFPPQTPHVMAYEAVQVEHEANDNGRGGSTGRVQGASAAP